MRIVHYPHPSPAPSVSIATTPETLFEDLKGISQADVREDNGILIGVVDDGIYRPLDILYRHAQETLDNWAAAQPRIACAESEEGEGPEVGLLQTEGGLIAVSRYGRGYTEGLFQPDSDWARRWPATEILHAVLTLTEG